MYPLARLCSREQEHERYSVISLVIESERECTGADVDAHVDTLLKAAARFIGSHYHRVTLAVHY